MAQGISRGRKLYANQNHNVKQCSMCRRLYENTSDNFYTYTTKAGYTLLKNECIDCSKLRYRRRYQSKASEVKEYGRKWMSDKRAFTKLGMGMDDVHAMGGCAVCNDTRLATLIPIKDKHGETTDLICDSCRRAHDYLCGEPDRLANLEALIYRTKTYGGTI